MADGISDANRFAQDLRKQIPAATVIGMNALKPMIQFQVSILRMWADNLERFAGDYKRAVEETVTTIEKRSDKERAA
jgi:hypothetical protein